MELRTTINIEPSPDKISYNDPVIFIGSCFAYSMGSQFETGHMPVMINPAGTVFNPVSVYNTIDIVISEKVFNTDDLNYYNGSWFSFYHYTDFSSSDPSNVLDKINTKTKDALSFLKNAGFLFITFGTARVYRLKTTGQIVSNCHKLPSDHFEHSLLSVSEIVQLWSSLLSRLHLLFPRLKVIFTISPVRHLKNGAHGNQVSKSALFLAVEDLLNHPSCPQYFPAYELVMDDLRDYRFYDEDMLHPSSIAVKYIWDAFTSCYLKNTTLNTWNQVAKINKAFKHRISTDSENDRINFADRMLKQISQIENKIPKLDLSRERDYFLSLTK